MPNEQQAIVSSEVVEEILRAITQLRFGSIEITVHEGRVTQIEKREKVRFQQDNSRNKSNVSSLL
ncbi:YezD family protein [Methyloradius palustris]|uniref:DUF2292 domain-containing protein n=1 Tax=Methyloradius palustris TaxID=2778876 RepID=A0A8D5G1K5_9PROT|nr:YezD family protein [Methyloradius palustris]BCM24398.1 hypothetical protein ZMTM_06570 [Methyloradius palustris]